MSKQQNGEYSQIKLGYQFPQVSYKLDSSTVSTYLKAVEETSNLYQSAEVVPPTAVAAYAMRALSEGITIPPGVIHVSQGLEFMDTVTAGDTITCQATVSRKQDRGRLHLLTIDLSVFNQNRKKVLAGKTGFVLPEPDTGNSP
jgi:acyl dehydratase